MCMNAWTKYILNKKISLKIGCYHHDYIKFLMQLAKKVICGKAKLINVKRLSETYN